METILTYEGQIRLTIFFGLFIVFSAVEYWKPARSLILPRRKRWPANLGITVMNTLILRLFFPTAAVGVAVWAQGQKFGIIHQLNLSGSFGAIIGSVVLLDVLIYFQHRIFHKINFFWQWHQVHHADLGFDISTGSRFHPIEILLSMIIKVSFITLWGIHPIAVIIFEIILSSMALFNHGNFKLPAKLEPIVRYLLVTPDMHRIHHSQIESETDSNYGFNFSLWDRIFGSYCAVSSKGENLDIGLRQWHKASDTATLKGLLCLPFKKNM